MIAEVTRRALVREVWPDPDQDLLGELRRAGFGRRMLRAFMGDWRVFRWESGLVSVEAVERRRVLLVEAAPPQHSFWVWPPLGTDIDPAWRAASMLTALRGAVQEEPVPPVGYKVLWDLGVAWPNGLRLPPARYMPWAVCRRKGHKAPDLECLCEYHAALYASELVDEYPAARGVLVVTPVGRCVWHQNAWRAAAYQVHAAVVDLDWVQPADWDEEIPVVRARRPLVPWRAYELAREVRAMLAMEA